MGSDLRSGVAKPLVGHEADPGWNELNFKVPKPNQSRIPWDLGMMDPSRAPHLSLLLGKEDPFSWMEKREKPRVPEFSWKKRPLEFSPSLNPKSNKQLIFHVNLYLGKIISHSLRGKKKGTLGNTLIKADFCKALTNSCQRREQVGCFLLFRNGKIINVSLIPEVIRSLGNILHW